jgi:restriction endonuclease S subunit
MKKRIASVADVHVGYQFRGKVEPDPRGNVRVIQIKDIDLNRRVRFDDLVRVRLDRPDPYLTEAGNVLFLARGHRQYAVVVTEPVQDVIATGFFFILRLKTTHLLPEFLAWSINQPKFQEAMRPFVRGSHMPLVSKTDFQELTVPVPSLNVQRRIVTLNDLLDQERKLTATLQEKRAALVHALSQKAAHRR